MGRPQQPLQGYGCWGGFSRHLGQCEKNPRPGFLTCWWHRGQETSARIIKVKIEGEKRLMMEDDFEGYYCPRESCGNFAFEPGICSGCGSVLEMDGKYIASRRPTAHYHIGRGVAWVKRRSSSSFTCPATLPTNIFDRLKGGSRMDGVNDIVGMRIYKTAKAALNALTKATATVFDSGFSIRLKSLRTAAAMTQADLAEASGVPRQTIAVLEMGRRDNPTWDLVCRLADGLGCTVNDFRRTADARPHFPPR